MKYAIVESGGKQYKAVEGQTIEVDLLPLDVGKKIDLKDVLLVSDEGKVTIGTPTIAGSKVTATVAEHFKAPKIIVFKYKSRERYRVKQGHRQRYTSLMIEAIVTKGAKKKAVEAVEAPKEKPKSKSAPKTKTKTKTKTKAAAKTKTKTKTKAKTKPKTKTKTKTKTSQKSE